MRIPSDPTFFRLIRRSMAACVAVLAAAAWLFPAPLKEAADLGNPPNPARSAWFLLWVQELVSHGTVWIYPVFVAVAVFVALPWLPGAGTRVVPDDGTAEADRAPGAGALFVSLLLAAIVVLTLVAAFFRGKNWEWVAPF